MAAPSDRSISPGVNLTASTARRMRFLTPTRCQASPPIERSYLRWAIGWKGTLLLVDEHASVETTERPAPGRRPAPMEVAKSVAVRFYLQWLVPISVFIGIVLRTREWLYRKSLWLDELHLSASIVTSGFGRLTHPLTRGQVAPIGWLWAERASVNAFGANELALRLVPWVASLVALAAFPFVARRLIGKHAAPAATLVFATSPTLIYYAAEAKQYSSDVASSLLVLLATTQLYRHEPRHRSYVLWGVAGGTLVWFSQPAILVVVACGMVMAARSWGARKELLGVAAGGAIVAFSFGLDWLVSLKHQAQTDGLARYWRARGGYP